MPGAVHSIHFPAPDVLVKHGRSPAPRPGAHPKSSRRAKSFAHQINVMETFSSSLRDVELVLEKLLEFVNSGNRHGDLQVALSAARRLEASLSALIDAEEGS